MPDQHRFVDVILLHVLHVSAYWIRILLFGRKKKKRRLVVPSPVFGVLRCSSYVRF